MASAEKILTQCSDILLLFCPYTHVQNDDRFSSSVASSFARALSYDLVLIGYFSLVIIERCSSGKIRCSYLSYFSVIHSIYHTIEIFSDIA